MDVCSSDFSRRIQILKSVVGACLPVLDQAWANPIHVTFQSVGHAFGDMKQVTAYVCARKLRPLSPTKQEACMSEPPRIGRKPARHQEAMRYFVRCFRKPGGNFSDAAGLHKAHWDVGEECKAPYRWSVRSRQGMYLYCSWDCRGTTVAIHSSIS